MTRRLGDAAEYAELCWQAYLLAQIYRPPAWVRGGYGLSVTIQAIGPTLVLTALFR
jgi:hypothetical protein